ncbi:hypothetical protein ABAC460_19540 [Asticcacaulis sp. AC460]|uniref:penicillin-binding protein 2 n=1 Tax=Asticcacaulis sp. AC460 TaxID=1282360 RepID=UPI0003C41016|nr:penicillin-binding protein 2 [Asticcacaulis sp. AC460]ESQ87523.1 hypothetical protein ABAC460_19540 [Asticcacaulis sp. AC460]
MPEMSIVFNDINKSQGVFTRRAFLMGGLTALGLFALGGRLAHLEIVQGGKYSRMSAGNQFNFRVIPPPRGDILDRNGKLIAGNRPSFRVMIETNEIKDINSTLDQVSYILPQTVTSRRRILRDINQNQRSVPTLIAGDLSWEDFSKVSLYANDIPGLVADMDQVRAYYYGGAFSHVVGYVSKINAKDLEAEEKKPEADLNLLHHPSFRMGKQGIEKALDTVLRGTAGGKKMEVDANGRAVGEDSEGSRAPVAGQDVTLTLDADLQQRAVDVFGSDSGAAVMMDVHTGEVLCMSSTPGFDPNLFVSGIPSKTFKLLNEYERRPLLDKALSGTYPPGSTFKCLVAMAALEAGIPETTRHTCGGVFPYGNHVFRCDGVHGNLDMHGAIVTSCDVYFYNMAVAVGPDKIAEVARKFGLGQIFDIGIDGQKPGVVPDKAWKKEYFEKRGRPAEGRWWPGDTPSIGIGQGFTNINCLQNCVSVTRIANGRKVVMPHLIKAIGGKAVNYPEFADLSVAPSHIDMVRAAMADVVTSGTAARSGKLDLGPIVMAGKTGTAQSHTYKDGARATLHLDWERRDHAWFIAFAPADKPKYAMSVIVQHGGWGASSAAPKAREIMRLALIKDPEVRQRIVGPVKDTFDPAALKAAEAEAATHPVDIPVAPTETTAGATPPPA